MVHVILGGSQFWETPTSWWFWTSWPNVLTALPGNALLQTYGGLYWPPSSTQVSSATRSIVPVGWREKMRLKTLCLRDFRDKHLWFSVDFLLVKPTQWLQTVAACHGRSISNPHSKQHMFSFCNVWGCIDIAVDHTKMYDWYVAGHVPYYSTMHRTWQWCAAHANYQSWPSVYSFQFLKNYKYTWLCIMKLSQLSLLVGPCELASSVFFPTNVSAGAGCLPRTKRGDARPLVRLWVWVKIR